MQHWALCSVDLVLLCSAISDFFLPATSSPRGSLCCSEHHQLAWLCWGCWDTAPLLRSSPARVAYGYWGCMIPSLVSFPYTQHTFWNNKFWKGIYHGSRFNHIQNHVTSWKFSSSFWFAIWLLAVADCCLTTSCVNLPVFLCVKFICCTIRLSFLNCSFLFCEEREEIRRWNWSVSLIPFLIVLTQITFLCFYLVQVLNE